MSNVPQSLKIRLLTAASTFAVGAVGVLAVQDAKIAPEVIMAMEIGAYYESSGRHIGTPYIDKIGKGQPLTVCNGVTGRMVVADRYYTEDDCRRLEYPIYKDAARSAKQMFTHWDAYNPWVRASIIDMIYNLGAASVRSSTMLKLANAGDLMAACAQMPRWVFGTVNAKSVKLPGLVNRRGTTAELCSQGGKPGHWTYGMKV